MYSIHRISDYLQKVAGLTDSEKAVVKYALEVLKTTTAGIISIILVALLLGVLKYALLATVAMSCYRILSGGAHSAKLINCSLTGALVSPGIGMFVKHNQDISGQFLMIFVGLVFMVSIVSVWQFAPADTPSKPITKPKHKRNLRILSFIYIICWAAVSLLALAGQIHIEAPVIAAVSMGVLWQSFTLRPSGYWFIKKLDDVLPK